MKKNLIKFGLICGLIIFNTVFPLWNNENFEPSRLAIKLPVWLAFGFAFGYVSRKRNLKNRVDNYE